MEARSSRAGHARMETNMNMGPGVGTQGTLPYCVMSWLRDVYRSHSPRSNADGLVFEKKTSLLGGIWQCGWDEHSTSILVFSKYPSCLPKLLAVVLAQWRGISRCMLAVISWMTTHRTLLLFSPGRGVVASLARGRRGCQGVRRKGTAK